MKIGGLQLLLHCNVFLQKNWQSPITNPSNNEILTLFMKFLPNIQGKLSISFSIDWLVEAVSQCTLYLIRAAAVEVVAIGVIIDTTFDLPSDAGPLASDMGVVS